MVQLVGSSSLGLGKIIDGKNQFVHIRYSANADGSNMTVEIQANTKYIGIATNSSETAPASPSDYSWGRFVGTSGTSSYTWIRYSSNEDGSNMTTTANEKTKYIGVAITSENSAPTDYTRYSWALFKGNDGRGVKKTEVTYQKSVSGTVIPTDSWLTSIPSVNDGEYLWTRTLFTYTDGTTTSTFSVSRNGTSGLGISRADVHYQKSTSGTTAPTGTWTVTIPTAKPNEYLWTRTTTTYTDYSTSVSYSVGKMGADGRDAQLLYLTASSQIQAFDKDDRPKTTQPITISVKLQNASGTATFTAIPYIGTTAQTPITLGGTGNDRTLLPSQWVNPDWTTIAITATLGSLTDTVSIIRIKDGEAGNDGIPGRDGVGLKTTVITYGISNSETTQPTTWSSQVPTLTKGKYLWTKTVWTYTDDTTETGYQKTYIARDGNDGINGLPGKDGVGISSTTITYAASTSGTSHPTSGWSTTIPSVPGGQYLWTKIVWAYTDGTSETGYSVARIGERGPQGLQGIQGPRGDQGIAGPAGSDGRTSYTHIAYANSADGNLNFSTSDSNRKYIGVYVDFKETDSTNPSSYQWSLIKGEDGRDGADGLPGKPGADGRTPYFHTAYANSADGSSGFSTTDSNGKLYLGTCTDYTQADPTDYRAYTWVKIKGEQGAAYKALTTNYEYYQTDIDKYSANGYTGEWGVNEDISDLRSGDIVTLSVKNKSKNVFSLIIAKVNKAYKNSEGRNLVNTTSNGLLESGATGNGISSCTVEFYLSTSKTAQAGGSWIATQPTWSRGKYLWTRYKLVYTDGSITYTEPQCSSEWEAVNEIIVGGRNLFVDAGFKKEVRITNDYDNGYWYSYVNTKFNYPKFDDDCNYLYFTASNDNSIGVMQFFDTNKLIKGQTYSVRTQVKVDANTTFRYQLAKKNPDNSYNWYFKFSDITVSTIGEWVDIKWTFTIPKDDDGTRYCVAIRNLQTGTETALRIMKPKLEIGNMFTDFSFAPEDIQSQIDDANENIGNKVDQDIYDHDKSVIYDSIGDKLDTETFNQMKDLFDKLKQSYEAFVSEGGTFESELKELEKRNVGLVKDLGDKLAQLNFINTYMSAGEEGLLIGAKNSPMQMLLSKNSLAFMDGGQVVAYFSNQSFYINRGAVVESLQVGVHKLTKINNSHTVIQYISQ